MRRRPTYLHIPDNSIRHKKIESANNAWAQVSRYMVIERDVRIVCSIIVSRNEREKKAIYSYENKTLYEKQVVGTYIVVYNLQLPVFWRSRTTINGGGCEGFTFGILSFLHLVPPSPWYVQNLGCCVVYTRRVRLPVTT